MAMYFVEDPLDKTIIKPKFNMYKQAFLWTEQYDIQVLVGLFRCYKYFLVTPYNFEEDTNRKFGKYLSITVSLLCFVYLYFSIKDSYGLFVNSPITRFLLVSLWSIMNVLFLVSCFLNSNAFKQENWRIVLKSFDQTEYMLRKMNFQASVGSLRLLLQVVFIFVPYMLLMSFQIYLWVSSGDVVVIYPFVGSTVTYLFMCFFLLFVLRLTGILKARYDFVGETLRKIADGKMDDLEKAKKLTDVVRLYKTFIFMMENINSIFGPHLFFIISVTISYILCAISYNMNISADDEMEKNSSILSITITIVYILALVVLIMSCDALETSGLKVIKTCYILHESTESRLVKDHLLQMAQYAEQWRPTLSAAGFYNVNQSTLSSIFEAIITYLVIIIQFNLALA